VITNDGVEGAVGERQSSRVSLGGVRMRQVVALQINTYHPERAAAGIKTTSSTAEVENHGSGAECSQDLVHR